MNRNSNPQIPLSVVIVNRNTADLLIRCLDHVFRSKLNHRPQVIVVDNGSSDDSIKRVTEQYPDVIVIEAGRNLGFASANNRALEKADGRYLLLVNTDAMLEKDCAAKLMSLMEDNPTIGMAGPRLLNDDGTPQTSYEAVPTLATETLNRSLLKRLFPKRFPGKHRNLTKPESVEALIGAVMMIRREALDQVGGFDEDYFFFLEETDLAVRMRKTRPAKSARSNAGASGSPLPPGEGQGEDLRGKHSNPDASEAPVKSGLGEGDACVAPTKESPPCDELTWKVIHDPSAKAIHLQGATAGAYQAAARIEFYRSRYLFFRKHYGSAKTAILKLVMIANLTLNVIFLGLSSFLALGKARSLKARFKVRTDLWKWHLQGCPDGVGLPRE
jgi:GT2 family glycosyltransferase